VSGRVEAEGGNRKVPAGGVVGGADANFGEEGGSREKHGFPRATEPEAEEAES
jgi:hypothetical protein